MPATTITQAGVWNLSLARLGASRMVTAAEITTPTLTETKAISAVWDMALEQALRAFPWHWANKRAALVTAVDAVWDGWSYRYVYPADCVRVLSIDDGNALRTAQSRTAFKIVAKDDLSAATILTDKEDAVAIYTALVTDVAAWDATFVVAISWLIASEIAFALNRPRTKQSDLLQVYGQVIEAAWATSRDEEDLDDLPDTASVAARG